MIVHAQRRGAPLVTLGLLLVLWVLVRATTWQHSGAGIDARLADTDVAVVAAQRSGSFATNARGGWRAARSDEFGAPAAPSEPLRSTAPRAVQVDPVRLPPPPSTRLPPLVAAEPLTSVRHATGHQLLWLAALSRMPLPPVMQAMAPVFAPPAVPPIAPAARPAPGRWSGDAWLLWRRDGGTGPATGPAPASYGASQVGAVIRYRLDPRSARKPTAYARASAPLERGRDRELAFGFSARPLAGVPLVASGELRIAKRGAVRPAGFVVTELPPAELPLGLRAEAYAQAGYVGGRDSTAFVDGQVRLDRRVAQIGPTELRLGTGAWGGAQDGASRLDLGPAATLGVPGTARLAFDWRFRVAGQATPASGPTLTLSAGF